MLKEQGGISMRNLGIIVFLFLCILSVGSDASCQEAAERSSLVSDSVRFDQEAALAVLRQRLNGMERRPAEEVFKNIKLLKGVPSARLLKIMEIGYSKSLGVNCTHCHVPDRWEREDKPTKQITREMSAMVTTINNDLLTKIKSLKSEKPVVNCTTCHRGHVSPALNMP